MIGIQGTNNAKKKKMIWKFESLVEVGKRVIFYKYKN